MVPSDPPPVVFDKELILRRYELNPPLPAADVEAFEKKYNITLPEDYKYFITQIGNGGGHHLFPLGEWAFDETFHRIDEPDWKIVGDLSQPFPHTEDWTFPDSLGIPHRASPRHAAGGSGAPAGRMGAKLEEEYVVDNHLMNGAMPIYHLGCGDSQWLVVNGPQKGYVWNRYGLDIVQLRDAEGRPMTFTDWFLKKLHTPPDPRMSELYQLISASYGARPASGWTYGAAAFVGGVLGLIVAPAMRLRDPGSDLIVAGAGAASMCLLVAALDRWMLKQRK